MVSNGDGNVMVLNGDGTVMERRWSSDNTHINNKNILYRYR
jgi:hypothetical protein